METVYIDVLFMVNVTFDLISVYITSCICSISLRTWRCLVACVIGGIYGVWGSIWCRSYYLLIPSFFLITIIMCAIAFSPKSTKAYIRCFIVLIVAMLLCGSLSYYLLILCIQRFGITTPPSDGKVLIFAAIATVSGAMLTLGSYASKRQRAKKRVTVSIRIGENKVSFSSISDTGNILRDPLSGKSVIILSFDYAQRLVGINTARKIASSDISVYSQREIMTRLRVVPYQTVNGKALMWCICADEILIDGIRKEALIGISEKLQKETSICPASLL